jgi:hypothetical protein
MNIPLDNLYHWIRGCVTEPVCIYIFSPHGSKNITDLNPFEPIDGNPIAPEIVCHDQEPLNFDTYQTVDMVDLWRQIKKLKTTYNYDYNYDSDDLELKTLVPYYKNLNFFAMLRLHKPRTIFDRYILLHSEKNSKDVEKFSCSAELVYYWSHAIIARDWYRFAEHDTRLNAPSQKKNTFLVYCRAWTGTREYRLKFLDLMAEQNLLSHCHTSILYQDQEFKLNSYKCTNTKFQPTHYKQLNSLAKNTYPAHASADYCVDDFVSTDISVVLETVATDSKIHLTEKTLRPIACGHPFMLIAGPGSLEYLRSYGFKTFSPWIDERYDQEPDMIKRMKMVTDQMTQIKNLSETQKKHVLIQLKKIAMHNKQHFFSDKFFNQIQSELVENLNTAVDQIKNTRGHQYFTRKKLVKKFINWSTDSRKIAKSLAIAKVLRRLRQDPSTSLKQILDEYPDGFF